MGNLNKRVEKIKEKLTKKRLISADIDPKTAFGIMIKVKQWKYGLDQISDKIEIISPEEWDWYVNHRKEIAKERNEDLNKVEQEIKDYWIEIQKKGGFKS